jgi:hypothetical protein
VDPKAGLLFGSRIENKSEHWLRNRYIVAYPLNGSISSCTVTLGSKDPFSFCDGNQNNVTGTVTVKWNETEAIGVVAGQTIVSEYDIKQMLIPVLLVGALIVCYLMIVIVMEYKKRFY